MNIHKKVVFFGKNAMIMNTCKSSKKKEENIHEWKWK